MKQIGILIIASLFSGMVIANDCSTYPLNDGLTVEPVAGGYKYLSTASAVVLFDDTDEVLDALKEAQLYAKVEISKFLNETIQDDDSLDKAVETSVTIAGDNKEANKSTLKKQLITIRNSSQSLLRGVIRIADCYTKGKLVKVTVGLKPETIAAATGTTQAINTAGQTAQQKPEQTQPSTTDSSSETEGFSNTSQLSSF